jgi:hypothetical protein
MDQPWGSVSEGQLPGGKGCHLVEQLQAPKEDGHFLERERELISKPISSEDQGWG